MPSDPRTVPVHRWQLIAGFVIICLIWGTSWAAVRVNVGSMPPAFSSGVRFLLAALFLGAIAWFRNERFPRDRMFWMLSGYLMLTAVTLPFGLVYWGQQRVDSGLSAVLFGTFPLWVALIAHWILPGERVTLTKGAGILLGFVGIAVVSKATEVLPTTDLSWEMAAIFGASFLQASALVAIRRYGTPYSVVMLNLIPMAVGALALLGWSGVFESRVEVRVNVLAVASLVYLAAFATVASFVLYYWLAKHIEAVVLSFSAFVTPVIAVVTGWFLLGERLAVAQLAGSLLVLAGIALATIVDRRNSVAARTTSE